MVKVDRAISMLELRQLLPKTVFETRISSEGALFKKKKKKENHNGFVVQELHFQEMFQ